LDVLARVVLFSRIHSDFSLVTAVFSGGVYVVRVLGTEVPEKPFVSGGLVGEHIVCKDLVLSVLKLIPATRSDDNLLLFEVWKRQGLTGLYDQVVFDSLFNAESITRARRVVQNVDGLFLPSLLVAKRRGISEEHLKAYYARGVVPNGC